MIKKQNLTIILFLVSTFVFGCDCDWSGNFIKSSKNSEVIIKAEVIEMLWHFEDGHTISSQDNFGDYLIKTDKRYFQSIKVEVLELIKGKEKRKQFEIYGSDGFDCRESIHLFQIGKIYIFGIYKTKKTSYSQPNEDENDYAISGCSEKWLEYLSKTNEVKGFIKGKRRRKMIKYDYNKFLKKLNK